MSRKTDDYEEVPIAQVDGRHIGAPNWMNVEGAEFAPGAVRPPGGAFTPQEMPKGTVDVRWAHAFERRQDGILERVTALEYQVRVLMGLCLCVFLALMCVLTAAVALS